MWFVHSPRAGVVLVLPSFIEKFIPRNHAMGVPCQELQCLKFLWSNADFLAATSDLGFEKVHRHVRKDIYVCALWIEARHTPD